MKLSRVLASAAFFSIFMSSQVVKAEEASVDVTESTEVVEEDSSCCDSQFGGFMFGVGIGWNNAKYKLKLKMKEEFGADVQRSKTVNLFNGVFWLGYGWNFGNYYIGLVADCDFGKSKDFTWSYRLDELAKISGFDDAAFVDKIESKLQKNGITGVELGLKIRTEGFSPTLALRFGYIPSSCHNLMAYVDVGATYRHVKAMNFITCKYQNVPCKLEGAWLHIHGVSPIVRVGVQKMVYNNIAVDFNCGYRFKVKKQNNFMRVEGNEGFEVHLSAIYNVKL